MYSLNTYFWHLMTDDYNYWWGCDQPHLPQPEMATSSGFSNNTAAKEEVRRTNINGNKDLIERRSRMDDWVKRAIGWPRYNVTVTVNTARVILLWKQLNMSFWVSLIISLFSHLAMRICWHLWWTYSCKGCNHNFMADHAQFQLFIMVHDSHPWFFLIVIVSSWSSIASVNFEWQTQ